jgi:hypothetical protein
MVPVALRLQGPSVVFDVREIEKNAPILFSQLKMVIFV